MGLEVGLLLIALGFVVLPVGLLVLVSYNRFVRQRALVAESWGSTDVELTRRHDLVPNLVRTVQGYAAHERDLLDALVRSREDAARLRGGAPAQRGPAEDALTLAERDVLARAEAYPDLKASASFLALQRELANTENRIAAARRFFNGNVRAYNTRCATFPSNVVAALFGFRPEDFFELRDPVAREAPPVA